ncbi:MAG: hypothetical protein A2664_04880 [Candidatus Taylorbacteria bacterium RIFCSPHIGHO2_01_FULL_46_22b]|uniref:Phospholipid/glycerol acyltransferase domain-containing protein n=1 Tax=Candidatus Taylorbacteria bacterium RIFCSPHIGHO2_01_FULL_46_22b TaxID=1802301 RepID=A0A1G2M4H0_9BACT|nr:MAG: hypothetical protein A2664_04880 [Candidatus Taylorbacteria bacterium RIFCSPHIGHO2_01_FULL_46_22b]
MNSEQYPASLPNNSEHKKEKKGTPKRLLLALEVNIRPLIGEISVSGRENLEILPPDRKVVVATTHISDLDIPLVVKTLGSDFDMAISDVSTHHHFFEDPMGNASITVAGKENFFPIDYKKRVGGKDARFNPNNFVAMRDAMESGKEIVVSAHNPSETGGLTRGGVGAVYLSQIADAVLLPVAVDMKSKEPFLVGKNMLDKIRERPDVDVLIGKPIELTSIKGIGEYQEIFDKRRNGEKLSAEEVARFKQLSSSLREQSEILMRSLAALLPDEKRGSYSEHVPDSQ